MSPKKVVGLVLLALGIVALAYRGFTYTRQTHRAKLGSLELTLTDKERVEIPLWVGAGLAIAGGVLLGWGGRRRRGGDVGER